MEDQDTDLKVMDLEELRQEIAEKKEKKLEATRQWRASLSPEERRAMHKRHNLLYKEKYPEKLREWKKAGYIRNREAIVIERRRKRHKLKAEMIELKGGKCVDCGGTFPAYAYDFHHVNGRDMVVGNLVLLGRDALLEELNKCILLCAICHRGRHVMDDED